MFFSNFSILFKKEYRDCVIADGRSKNVLWQLQIIHNTYTSTSSLTEIQMKIFNIILLFLYLCENRIQNSQSL